MNDRAAVIITSTYVAATRLRRRRGRWAINGVHRVPCNLAPGPADDGSEADLAGAVLEATRDAGAVRMPADVIVPSTWCFVRRLDWPDQRFRETTAAYQLEEFIPVTLEEVTCAFARDRSRRVWAVATPTNRLKHLLEQLETAQVPVEHVRVDLFAALAEMDSSKSGPTWLILSDARRAALAFRKEPLQLPDAVRTVYLPQSPADGCPERQIALTEAVTGLQAVARVTCDLQADLQPDGPESAGNALTRDVPCAVADTDGSLHLADLLLSTARHPEQLDLRTGPLAAPNRFDAVLRRASRCALLLALLLVALIADAHWQRADCRRLLADVRQQQSRLYQEMLPNRPVPLGPAMRLASERKRLEALTKPARPSPNPTDERTALRLELLEDLRDFVARLPGDVRIRLLELTLDAEQLTLRGQTADHRDAERIAEAVSTVEEFSVRPPRTSRLKSGAVEFAIHARRDGHAD
jgi:type II secretory pathway component PulL